MASENEPIALTLPSMPPSCWARPLVYMVAEFTAPVALSELAVIAPVLKLARLSVPTLRVPLMLPLAAVSAPLRAALAAVRAPLSVVEVPAIVVAVIGPVLKLVLMSVLMYPLIHGSETEPRFFAAETMLDPKAMSALEPE